MGKKSKNGERNAVYILLTKYSDCISSFLYYIGGRGYTHASISLDGGKTYYSFNYRGFCTETLEKHRHRGVVKSVSYEINVSESDYERMREQLIYFIEHKEQFHYTRLGVAFCLLHIPFNWKNHFFCSQFVAYLLTVTEEITICRPAVLCLPNHFQRELEKSPFLKEIRYSVV
ncbi:hypothetical protein [Luxibacter massiliensis]|uniref:hypothetical protein n=1 Tax=Luxibacter massiliensis TaxID=2219695 RepID=UPI000F0497DE|nr:hypothetical protein [Luxibacter massiliensis]